MLQQITRFCHVSIILRTSKKHPKTELYVHHFQNKGWKILQYIFKGLLAIPRFIQQLLRFIYVEETMSSRHSHVHLS